ncbi:hypothetical protein L249_4610 [Ophiocordyceps polyrhachis-furcata BCC 54312]|uniref:GAG-pre-integrase domain-containing protein n=1 Tax=Ophiocordyceps polyrhachis-furcata BCC 54312 TaxID=1330021 RepID=A0A367LC33_9HYPO|nr:hypothetical protein L249_4610 [Ophiocordyceps polyrhachis-furcata BCC 54312]
MQRICALDNRLRIISAIPAGGDLSGSKADFAIIHERLAHAGKEKVIQACRKAGIIIEKSTVKGFLCKACYFAKADTIITYKLLRGWKRQVNASSGGIPIATIAFDNAKSRPNASNDSEGYLSLHKASSDALAALYIDSSGYTAYITKLKEKIVRSEKIAPRAWKGYLVGIEVIRARDIRFVNRARLSAIIEDPSIEFKASYEDAVALEIYDSLRLERSRDRDRTRPDITYSVKKLLEANCHLIHAYLVALKHLLRYLRGIYSLRITLGGAAYRKDL